MSPNRHGSIVVPLLYGSLAITAELPILIIPVLNISKTTLTTGGFGIGFSQVLPLKNSLCSATGWRIIVVQELRSLEPSREKLLHVRALFTQHLDPRPCREEVSRRGRGVPLLTPSRVSPNTSSMYSVSTSAHEPCCSNHVDLLAACVSHPCSR